MTFNSFAILVLQTFAMLFVLMCLLRMLLQVVKADYYNPISQSIISATNKLVIPLRRVVPSIGPIDSASLLVALIITVATGAITLVLMGVSIPVGTQIAWGTIALLLLLVKILWWALFISVILSWFPAAHQNPIAQLVMQLGFGITTPLRKVVPNLGMLDLSPIIGFLIIIGIEGLLTNIAIGMNLGDIYGWL